MSDSVSGMVSRETILLASNSASRKAMLSAAQIAFEAIPADVDERALEAGLGSLMMVAEGYPDLKADAAFLSLQRELSNTEDRIAAGRRFYNANVRELNQLCRTFPSSLVAGVFGFKVQGFFEAEDRAKPEIDSQG